MKPTNTANHRYKPTFSFNKKIENIVVNIGAAKVILTTVASGRFIRATKIEIKAINPANHIFKCKNRAFGKPSGMFSNYELLKEIQIMDSWKHDLIKAVIFDNNLPMSTVAPFKRDHPMFKNVDGWVLKNSTKTGTLDMLLNAGEFHNEMTKQSMELEMPVLGSSANTSLTGSKYNLDDIDLPVIKAANILIDGGTSKYKNEKGRSSTIIDFDNFETIRIGVCYDKIRKIFTKFGIELREDIE